MSVRYPNLEAEMARHGHRQKDLAECTGLSIRTIRNKMLGDTYFAEPEMFAVRRSLFPTLTIDYLFADTPQTTDELLGRDVK